MIHFFQPARVQPAGKTPMPSPKILLVDGYNVIHKIPELKAALAGGLESARQKLALLVSAWRFGHPQTDCAIIFDGDHQFSGGRASSLSGIRCLFSRTAHNADAEIIRFVREYHGPKSDIVVVSDDNSVRNSCRAHGAAVESTNFILASARRPSPVPKTESAAPGKGLSPKAAADVTAELKKKFGL